MSEKIEIELTESEFQDYQQLESQFGPAVKHRLKQQFLDFLATNLERQGQTSPQQMGGIEIPPDADD